MSTIKRFLSSMRLIPRTSLRLMAAASIAAALLLGFYLYLIGSPHLPAGLIELFYSPAVVPPPVIQDEAGAPDSMDLPFLKMGYNMQGSWPGIRLPPTRSAEKAGLADDTEIVGVCVEGQTRAYLIDALSRGPTSHVVNDILAGHPLSVAYCPVMRCAQVFTSASSAVPLDLGIGGWRVGKGMILQLRGVNYTLMDGTNLTDPEGSPLPYQRMDYEKTTWGKWHRAHPDTDVYVGSVDSSSLSGKRHFDRFSKKSLESLSFAG